MEFISSGHFWWPLLTLLAVLLAYIAASWVTWAVAGSGLLLVFTLYAEVAWWIKVLAWSVYAVPMLLLNVPMIRRPLLSDRILLRFRESLPPLTDWEREALDVGTSWWEAELFSGRPRWRTLLREPAPALSTSEREFLMGPVDRLCGLVEEYALSREPGRIPDAARQLLQAERLYGLGIPTRYGGREFSPYGIAAVIVKVASRSTSAALALLLPGATGIARLLLNHGTEAQRQRYLPALANGSEVACFAWSAPETGSDAAAVSDVGVVCRRPGGKQGEVPGLRLDFDKRYVTLGPTATLLAVAVRLHDPEQLLGERRQLGLCLVLVPADAPGVQVGPRHDLLNTGVPFGPVRGNDVFVPIEALVGGTAGAGRAWRMWLEMLSFSRSLAVPALCAAAAKTAGRITGAYARIRYQYQAPIGSFEGVQEALAGIAGHTYVIEAARLTALAGLAAERDSTVVGALAKYNLTQRCRKTLNLAMEVHAGAGLCLGPSNRIGELHKFATLALTSDGANIVARSLITFGRGVVQAHPHVRAEIEAAQDEDGELGAVAFDRTLIRHLSFVASNALRTLVHAVTRGRLTPTPRALRGVAQHVRQITRMSAAFALMTDVTLLVLGGELKRRERVSARLADVLSQLYLASATLRHFHQQGDEEADQDLADWALQDCLHRTQEALQGLLANLPSRWLRRALRLVVFPGGLPYRRPGDALEQRLATALMVPSSVRDRLTGGIYMSREAGDPIGRLEDALEKVTLAEPLLARLRDGVRLELIETGPLKHRLLSAIEAKLLTPEEAEAVRVAEQVRRQALAVDEFDPIPSSSTAG